MVAECDDVIFSTYNPATNLILDLLPHPQHNVEVVVVREETIRKYVFFLLCCLRLFPQLCFGEREGSAGQKDLKLSLLPGWLLQHVLHDATLYIARDIHTTVNCAHEGPFFAQKLVRRTGFTRLFGQEWLAQLLA